ncbi:hypothetical protein ACNSOL_01325 [Aliarcobacter lanthieri]|uniref:hypothetical protein n=1 Tax=Aliarcobacter lanthieri TaxID=1355374 RepID=UPI003AB015DB
MKVQIIVADNLVIIDSKGINFDCSIFKDKFIFCEVNENEKWIEKEPFEGREDLEDWTDVEDFISEVKSLLNKEENLELIELKQYLKDTDFYYIRLAEIGEAVPVDVVERRLETRAKIREIEDN